MADESIPPVTPQNSGGDDASENPKPKTQKKKKKKIPNPESGRKGNAAIIFTGVFTFAIAVSALNGLWHEWWVKYGLIPSTLIAIGVGIYELVSKHTNRSKVYSSIIAIFSCLLILGGVCWAYKLTAAPAFYVAITMSDLSTGSSQPNWNAGGEWFVDGDRDYRRVTPVDGGILVEFTNLKPEPIMITAYVLEVQLTNGPWVVLETVKPNGFEHGKTFFGDLTNADEIKYTTFDSAIQDKNIAPNETVRGWIIIKFLPLETNLRLEVRDATGLSKSEPFSPWIRDNFAVPGALSMSSQPPLFEITTNHEDLSSLHRW